MISRILRSLALVLVLGGISTMALAQDILIRGKVENVGPRFVLNCSVVELRSGAINLNAWVGQFAEMTGPNIGTPQAPIIVVNTAAATAKVFEIGGNGKIGGEFKPSVTGTPGDTAWMFGGITPGFAPQGTLGTLLLQSPFFLIGARMIPAGGVAEIIVSLPNNPALVGLQVFGQAVVLHSGALALSNPDCATISN